MTRLTDSQLENLLALSKKATPSPREFAMPRRGDMDFYTALSPEVVAALVSEVQQARADQVRRVELRQAVLLNLQKIEDDLRKDRLRDTLERSEEP